ncbi:type II toxin-antitoxin system VapC family toxin [Candidatus Pacearchaeota archaeon]|nr:type II toxin-antitoxin system VapC family toxin [Candidatus Pacearchaeota archaeon]
MIFIDSDCIIDFLRGKENAKGVIEDYQDELGTSQINVFEVLFGIFKKKVVNEQELALADNFFNSITVFPFDDKCGRISAKIFSVLMKEGKMIEQNDCFIGAIMLKNNLNNIISNNKKHFSRIKGIKVISY